MDAPKDKRADGAPTPGAADALTPENLNVGGRYHWRNQPERLVYIGPKQYRGDGRRWHQFGKVEAPHSIWCEVLDSDLAHFEESAPASVAVACPECRQTDHGQTGEYPCPHCGMPRLWDAAPSAAAPSAATGATDARERGALAVDCPHCWQKAGEPCIWPETRERNRDAPHKDREAAALASQDEAPAPSAATGAIDAREQERGGELGMVESHPNYVAGFKAGHAAGRKRAALASQDEAPAPSGPDAQQAVSEEEGMPGILKAMKWAYDLFYVQGHSNSDEREAYLSNLEDDLWKLFGEMDDLSALVARLARALRKAAPSNDLAEKAVDYLRRKGLQGSPLRDATIPASAPSQQTVLVDAPGAVDEDWREVMERLVSALEWHDKANFCDVDCDLTLLERARAMLKAAPDTVERQPINGVTFTQIAAKHLPGDMEPHNAWLFFQEATRTFFGREIE